MQLYLVSIFSQGIPKLMVKRKEHRQGRRHYRRCKRQRRAAAHGTLSKKCKKQDTAQGGNISKRAQTIGVFERNLPGCENSVLCIGIKNKIPDNYVFDNNSKAKPLKCTLINKNKGIVFVSNSVS